MSGIRIAVAQTGSEKGGIAANIKKHLQLIELAGEAGVHYLVFPELSLTGYEPELAQSLALAEDASVLSPLREAAKRYEMFVLAGGPLKPEQKGDKPCIASFIFTPQGHAFSYSKMNLHPGEETYFSTGDALSMITLEENPGESGVCIGNAICADMLSGHIRTYAEKEADAYVGGVLISPDGYQPDSEKMAEDARQYNMLIGMANYNQPTGGWQVAGKSGFWTAEGLLAAADGLEECIVVVEHQRDQWIPVGKLMLNESDVNV